MSVMEIVNQVKTMPAAEQLKLFKEIHQLEAEQHILEQLNLLDGANQAEFFSPVLSNEDMDYVSQVYAEEKGNSSEKRFVPVPETQFACADPHVSNSA
jgi:hypothetical protein